MTIFRINIGNLLVAIISLAMLGCASAPPSRTPIIAEEEFRDADFDLLFATEFPVANKAEALARADAALKANDLDRAVFFYVKALKFDPEDADLLTRIGSAHRYQKNSTLAVRAYSLALRSDPNQVKALEGRGLLLLEHDKGELAYADLTRAVELDPSAWRSQNALGLIADQRKQHEQAVVYYTKALAGNAASGILYNNRGYSRLLAGDYALAEADLLRAAEQFSYTQAWINLGVLYARQKKYNAAVDAFDEVLKLHEALNKTAETALVNGDYVVARQMLKRAIELAPTWYEDAEENLLQAKLAGEADTGL